MRPASSLPTSLVLVKHAMPVREPAVAPRHWRLGVEGEHQSRRLARRLLAYAPLRLVASPEPKALMTGQLVAAELGLNVSAAAGLEEFDRPPFPLLPKAEHERIVARIFEDLHRRVLGAESGRDALTRFSAAVDTELAQTDAPIWWQSRTAPSSRCSWRLTATSTGSNSGSSLPALRSLFWTSHRFRFGRSYPRYELACNPGRQVRPPNSGCTWRRLVHPRGRLKHVARPPLSWGLEALNGAVSEPAWKTKPSWYLVATEDRMIPPDAQRAMSKRAGSTVVEAKGSHAVYVSQPQAVADLIAKAANGMALATR